MKKDIITLPYFDKSLMEGCIALDVFTEKYPNTPVYFVTKTKHSSPLFYKACICIFVGYFHAVSGWHIDSKDIESWELVEGYTYKDFVSKGHLKNRWTFEEYEQIKNKTIKTILKMEVNNMDRKKELEKMTVLGGLSDLARQYNLDIDHLRKSEIIEVILKHEQPQEAPESKKTRGPRDKASTKLKALRVASGHTQLEVAVIAGLNPRTYQYYEQGNKPIEGAKLETLIKICLALNCKLDQIIEAPELVELLKQYN